MAKRFLTNGKFFPFNPISSQADTVEITDGIITKVGKAEEILPLCNQYDPVIDLKHSFILPGFTDSHIHLLAYGQNLQRIDLAHCTKQECILRIIKKVSETPPGEWIIGHGWDHNKWKNGFGNNDDLDAISKQHPIYLSHKSLHCAWVNSFALQLANITSETQDPSGGIIGRGKKGIPFGILLENAMQLVESIIPEPNLTQMQSALIAAQNALNRFGVTSVHDFDHWSIFSVLQKIIQDQQSTLRVTKGIPKILLIQAIAEDLKSGSGNDWLRIGWLKLFSDGALGSQTAAMIAPYSGSKDHGLLLLEKEQIVEIGKKSLQKGIALAVHAIGDQANKTVLSGFETLNNIGLLKIPSLPSRIEHVQIIDEKDMRKFNKLNVVASMQPIHAISDAEMAEAYWGDRCSTAYAWRSLAAQDVRLIFGSDAPVESPNPFHGIAASLSRKNFLSEKKDIHHTGWTTHQCITLRESLMAYCKTPSQVSGFSSLTGEIVKGKFADIVILPKDFDNYSPQEIFYTKPLATMINGNWVYINDKIDIDIK